MHYPATTREQFLDGIAEMGKHPIIGTTTIGSVTVNVSARRWSLQDDHGNRYEGKVTNGRETRYRITKALRHFADHGTFK